MVFDSEMEALLNEYEAFVSLNFVCKEPELYEAKHTELIHSARGGDTMSLRSIGITLLKGDKVPSSFDNAREIFYRLFLDNEDDWISRYYYFKCLCFEGNYSEGMEGMANLASLNFAPAIAFRGNSFEFGQCGLEINLSMAKHDYESSICMNHVPGAFLLSKLLLREQGLVGKLKGLSAYMNAVRLSAKAVKNPSSVDCLTF